MLRSLLRGSLWLALLPTAFLAVIAISWRLRVDLWRWDKPVYPLVVLFITCFPLLIGYGLVRTATDRSVKAISVWSVVVWAIILAYVAFAFGWMPRAIYDAWGRMV
jgi:hypothetical protein